MNQIVKTFNNVKLNITKEGDEVWFWGKECAEALGYVLPHKAITDHIKEDEKRKVQKATIQNGSLPQKSMSWQINESGLYRLIFSSKLPLAEDFRKWLFTEVLPSIRKTGKYSVKRKHNQLSIMSERDLHHEFVKEVRKRFPHLVLVAQMGELQDTSWKRINAWKNGYIGGQPDLLVTNPHRRFNGFCIEFKNPGGTGVLSEKQVAVLKVYKEMGFKVSVCDDLIEGLFEIAKYDEDVMLVCVTCMGLYKTETSLKRHIEKFHCG